MPFKLFYSALSGSQALKHNQTKIEMILQARGLEYEKIDITSSSNEEQKLWMREHGKPEQEGAVVLPPQLFKDDEFICNYNIFENAVEGNELEELLGIPKEKKESKEEDKDESEKDKEEGDEKEEKEED